MAHASEDLPLAALALLSSKMPLLQLAQLNRLCRPLQQTCCRLLQDKHEAIGRVFDDLILHAEVTFLWLVEEAQFQDLHSLLLDYAQFSRCGAMKVLEMLEMETSPWEGSTSDSHDLVQEFRAIQTVAMAKLSPHVKAREILRRSLRVEALEARRQLVETNADDADVT